jgi:dTDP-4-dehydrorhamnose reductase
MNRMLVIGAGGLIGNKFMELAANKFEVYGTYNSHPIEGSNIYRLNVVNRNDTFSLIQKISPDLVIDTHSLNNVDYCETHREEAWSINLEGTKNIAEACVDYGSKLVFFSTDYVFDGRKMKYSEKDKPRPLNYLGINKAIAEQMLELLGMNHISVRTSVVYGKGGLNKINFVLWLVKKLRTGEKVSVVTDQKNNPTYVDNIVQQVLSLCDKNKEGLYHITGSESLSRYEFSLKIADVFDLNPDLINPINSVELHQLAKRPTVVNMSIAKVEKETGFKLDDVYTGLKKYKTQMEM